MKKGYFEIWGGLKNRRKCNKYSGLGSSAYIEINQCDASPVRHFLFILHVLYFHAAAALVWSPDLSGSGKLLEYAHQCGFV
jgi:hypothetical protein